MSEVSEHVPVQRKSQLLEMKIAKRKRTVWRAVVAIPVVPVREVGAVIKKQRRSVGKRPETQAR